MAKRMKARNLKRFLEQWTEYVEETREDSEIVEFDEDDADFVLSSFNLNKNVIDKYVGASGVCYE